MANKKKVAIIGSGLIGRGWAMLFAGAGHPVSMYDSVPGRVQLAMSDIKEEMMKLNESGQLRGTLGVEEQLQLITVATSLQECIASAVHIQECVPESLEVKRQVFEDVDKLIGDDNVVISSSSSAIPPSRFTQDLKHSKQCLVSHPVNPPYFMPLVEIVTAPWTCEATVKRTQELLTSIGQSPVLLKKELPGFIQPRVQYALLQECLKLVMDDVISVKDIDKILTHGLGLRWAFMGPYETIHLNADGAKSYIDRYGKMIYGVSCESGTEVVNLAKDPRMQKVFEQLEEMSPLDKLEEKRKWRDQGIAKLNKLRKDMD